MLKVTQFWLHDSDKSDTSLTMPTPTEGIYITRSATIRDANRTHLFIEVFYQQFDKKWEPVDGNHQQGH